MTTATASATATATAAHACREAGLDPVGQNLWSKGVSDPTKRVVWLLVRVVPNDDRIDLRWETVRGNVLQEMALPINDRTAAILTAIASAEVNA
jgi:hypothetical protein